MLTVVVTYHGEARMYAAEPSHTLLALMFKCCIDFDVSPRRVSFNSCLGDECTEEDFVDDLIDDSGMEIAQLMMEDIEPGECAVPAPTKAELKEMTPAVPVDFCVETDGWKSLLSTKWIRPVDTLASTIGKLVLDGSFPFSVDVLVNGDSITKAALAEDEEEEEEEEEEEKEEVKKDTKKETKTETKKETKKEPTESQVKKEAGVNIKKESDGSKSKSVKAKLQQFRAFVDAEYSPGDLLLINDFGLSQGDVLRFVAQRSPTALESANRNVQVTVRGKKTGHLRTLSPSDTLSSVFGQLLLEGHLGMEVDLLKKGHSLLRRYLQQGERSGVVGSASLTGSDLTRGLINVPVGDLEIGDGDRLTVYRGRLPSDGAKIKVTVEPGGDTIERVVYSDDTLSSLIGSIVIGDDFSWSVDLFRGEDSLVEAAAASADGDETAKGRRLVLRDLKVKSGEQLSLNLCLGGGDEEEEEEEEETAVANGTDSGRLGLDIVVEDRISRKMRRQYSRQTSLAEMVGDLLLNRCFDSLVNVERGRQVLFQGQVDSSIPKYRSSTTLEEAKVMHGDNILISVRARGQGQASQTGAGVVDGQGGTNNVYAPIAFNDWPVTLLNARISPDLDVAGLAKALLSSGLVSKITGLRIGCLYGLSGDSLADDKRGLVSRFSVGTNTVIRVLANVGGAVTASTPSSKAGAIVDPKAPKRPAADIGPAEYPPVKLTITSSPGKAPAAKAATTPAKRYEFYVVVHNANSLSDQNKIVTLEDDYSVNELKRALEKQLEIPIGDQYMIWQTTCGTEGKPFYVEVWEAKLNRCWAREDSGEVLKQVTDNSETRIFHLHDGAHIKIPPNSRPLIRLRVGVEFYEFDKAGVLSRTRVETPLKERSVASWISGLLVRHKSGRTPPQFFMQASMGFACTATGGQYTKATIRQSIQKEANPSDMVVAYFAALIKDGSKIPKYPFRSSTRIHVWTRPGLHPSLNHDTSLVKFSTGYVEKYPDTWMINRIRSMSPFEVRLSEHFKKG